MGLDLLLIYIIGEHNGLTERGVGEFAAQVATLFLVAFALVALFEREDKVGFSLLRFQAFS